MQMKEFSEINLARCNTWHNINDWSPSDWLTAVVGELGEAANLIKKLNRLEQNIQQNANSDDRAALLIKIGHEIADTYTYLDLLAQRLGISLESVTIEKFNFISEREGLPHRIATKKNT